MEAILEEADKLSKGLESAQGLIEEFKKRIPLSKSLAKDAEEFCSSMEKILEVGPGKLLKEVGDLREELLDLKSKLAIATDQKEHVEEEQKEAEKAHKDFRESLGRLLRDNILPREPDATLRMKLELFTDELIRDPEVSIRDLSIRF